MSTSKNLAFTPAAALAEPGHEAAYAAWSGRTNINIGMPIVVKVARTRPARERDAIIWLANYARREAVTADALTELLESTPAEIRALLTNPVADIKRQVTKIESMRKVMESNLQAPADTTLNQIVAKACRFALEKGALTEVIAKTREGKTISVDHVHLLNLHQAIYMNCPATESYSDFIFALGRASGVSVGNGKKVTQIEAQIRSMYGRGGIRYLIVDEGHYLWPVDIKLKPKRIEFLRSLWDENKGTVGITSLATPQSLLSSNQATAKSKRWAPGQWEGRVVRFIYSEPDDATQEKNHYKVAKWHCPEGDRLTLDQLVLFAQISPGFYGAMVNSLKLARFDAEVAGKPLNVHFVRAAQQQIIKGTALELELKKKGISL